VTDSFFSLLVGRFRWGFVDFLWRQDLRLWRAVQPHVSQGEAVSLQEDQEDLRRGRQTDPAAVWPVHPVEHSPQDLSNGRSRHLWTLQNLRVPFLSILQPPSFPLVSPWAPHHGATNWLLGLTPRNLPQTRRETSPRWTCLSTFFTRNHSIWR